MMVSMADAQTQQAQAPSPAEAAAQPAAEKRKAVRRKATVTKSKSVMVKSKRKTSVARASVKPGKGMIRVNGVDINAIPSAMFRNMALDPLNISGLAKEVWKKTDITINVRGGGTSSQTQAVRGAIAKGLVAFSGSEALKSEFMGYDRALLVDDPRRVEPKKFRGPKARARFQTSYR